MSNRWNIVCVPCHEELLSEGYNHGERYLAEMVTNRHRLHGMAVMVDGTGNYLTVEASVAFGGHPFDLHFFVKHQGHELAVESEYGYRFGECAEYLTCGACGDRHMCNLPRGHEGPHERGKRVD